MWSPEWPTHCHCAFLWRVSLGPLPSHFIHHVLTSSSQPFWGEMIARTGAGPRPTPYKSLDVAKLTAAIRFCLTPGAVTAAQKIAEQMEFECGVDDAVESFHRHLPLDNMRCNLIPGQVAAWKYQKGENQLHLSSTALQFLVDHRNLKETDFQP